MIQYYKLFSLVIRVLIKPVVNFTKQYHMSKKEFSHERLRYFFIFLGKKYSLLEAKIYNTSLNQTSADLQKAKLLTEEVA